MTDEPIDELRDTDKADAVIAQARVILPALRKVARERGYALAYHGSFSRDIDVIAVPWTAQAGDPLALCEALRAETERVTGHTAYIINDDTASTRDYVRRAPEPKPHGRLAWSIHLVGPARTYIDLCVIPAGQAHTDAKITELERMLDKSYQETVKQAKLAQNVQDRVDRLKPWLSHKKDCDLVTRQHPRYNPCSCGLDDALSQGAS